MYNVDGKDRPEWRAIDWGPDLFSKKDPTLIECTVKEFVSTSGDGKFPSDFTRQVVINDLENYLPRMWNSTIFANNTEIETYPDFIDYVLNTPSLSL